MNVPWWAWVLLALALIVALVFFSAQRSRAQLRQGFLAHLEAEHPELEARQAAADEILVTTADGGEGSLYLHRIFREGARLEANDEEGRRELFARFAAMIAESKGVFDLDPEGDRARVFPRVVTGEFLRQVAAETDRGDLPSLPLGPPGLHVVFVLDSEHSVAYLRPEQLADLELSLEEALELARGNLWMTSQRESVRKPLDEGSMVVVKSFDTYDAARLLLVAEVLEEGEALAALIPDRDTLVLAPLPADGDWSSLDKLAKNAAGEPLWPQPLRVTPEGVFAVEP